MRNSIFVLSFLFYCIFFGKNVCCSDWFGGLISLPSVFAFSESFQRLQCLQSFTFPKTSMSSVFYIYETSMSSVFHISKEFNVLCLLLFLQDFDVFNLLHFQRLQYLQSFTFPKNSMSLVFYFYKTSTSLVLHISKDFNVFNLSHFERFQCLLSFTFF